jgi:predicted lipoprotein with Yx(FWY)xxD motif
MRNVTRRARRVGRIGPTILAVMVIGSVVAASAFALHGSSDRTSAGSIVKVRTTVLGRVLVDQRGRTLYLFEPDRFGRSVCHGKCAAAWPPLLTSGKPRAGSGAHAALLGTTRRADGRLQVTYGGYPLYAFVRDTKPGQTLGQGIDGFGGEWYVLDALGRKVEDRRHGGDPAVVQAGTTGLGRVLTDGRGRTVYLFEADKGGTSACYGACATAWPPLLTTGAPKAGAGALTGLLGTTKRRNGGLQVTYRGQPLYYFVRDVEAGQTLGQGIDGFGAEWYVVDRAGHKVEMHGSPGRNGGSTATTPDDSGGGSGSGGGYGGGYG